MRTHALIAFCILGLLTESCKKEPPVEPEKPATLTLTAEDASCTEAWLKATTTETPATVRLLRDGQRVSDLRLLTSDSLLFDGGLLPNRAFTYQLQKLGNDSSVTEMSASVKVTTLDTTSHDWHFEIDTLGVTASTLYDVAIISDSNAWAVGELYLNDSSGQLDPQRYNAAHWNGARWTVLRVPYYYQGQPFYNPIQTVFAFSGNDVWFAGNGVIRWNGQQYTPMEIPSSVWGPNRMNKIWGSTSNNLYIVGDGGSIAHFTNGTWHRVESGTPLLDIYDLYGETSRAEESEEIIAVAAKQFATLDNRVLDLSSVGATVLSNSGIVSSIHGLWFVPNRKYYIVGGGMYAKHDIVSADPWSGFHVGITQYYQYAITGKTFNDIFSVGSFGELLHFNGVAWKSLRERTALVGGAYYGVSMRNDFVVVVGYESTKAIIARGHRR